MKNSITFLTIILMSIGLSAQNNFWKNSSSVEIRSTLKERVSTPSKYRTISLDTESFLDFASNARGRFSDSGAPSLIITLPLPNGENETFTLEDSEVMHPDLAARFPQIKTFSGKGINDKTASIRITYSPYFGFSGMILSGKHSTVYIDPITTDNRHYMSYYRSNLSQTQIDFECDTEESIIDRLDLNGQNERVAALGDCNLRRYRLAQSCTGEYAQYHITQAGGTTGNTANDKAIVQAAMDVALNRVNGIYERDLGITMQFVPNNDAVIYLDASTDPWTTEWNTKTAQTLDAVIGVSNYDIGHNFNTTGGGNAGCLDCVCLSNSQNNVHKGRGYTGLAAPIGDPFYVDYVAHEMGHQFGGYHVQSNQSCRSGNGFTEVETGSGSTIMGYAGICSANVQNASDDYFAYVNIRDIVTSINFGNGSGCAELIASGNSGPSANAGLNYSIPKSTPFRLEGIGTDPDDSGLTYCWEQNDPENPNSNSAPTSTRTVGPMFRSIAPVAVPYRYFPNISAIIGNTTPTFEVLPSVSRSMDFSFIVRDNNSVSGCTASDLMTVTTVGAAGPFIVTAPNTNVTWLVGTTQTVTWNVAGTTASPINCANVDIFLSTDGGNTYPITLATSTPNDGSQSIVVPDNQGNQNRIMVKASNNIFFDISNVNFTISVPCTASVPTGLAASNIGSTSATLSWNQVPGATYDLRYRVVGSTTWTTNTVTALSSNISGLTSSTNYQAQVRSKCSGGSNSAYSSSALFTTLAASPYCASNGNNTDDEYIGRVQLNTLDNNSGEGTNGTGYSDFTPYSALTTDLLGGAQYTITITPIWTGSIYNEGYAVWIDYNNDADFDDSGEQVWTQAATTNTPVSGTFTIPSNISYGQTRMRVSLKYGGVPTACESFNYGEVEDYTVNLKYDGLLFTNNAWIPNAPSDTTAADNALVLDGTYTAGSSIALNNLTVNSGATVNVLQAESIELNGNLVNNGNLILNSTSNQYSSLIVNGTATGDVTYKRHVNVNASSGGNDLISAPVTGQSFGVFAGANTNIVSNSTNTTEKLFGPFDKATGTYLTWDTNVPAEATIMLNPGIGYRAASTDDGTFEFKGTVNTSTVNVNIFNSGPAYTEWNLIGNPYPSYIKLSEFLSPNNMNQFLSTSAGIYGYDGTSGGWKIWNMAYSDNNPNSIITPGQGFLVSSKVGGGTMVFNSNFRTIASGNALLDDDFIDNREANENEIAYLKLDMTNNLNSYSADFYFTDNASRGLDIGYDASAFNGIAPNYAIYSHLVEGSTGLDMSIQSVSFNDLNNNVIIPLGINATQGQQLTISIAEVTLPSDVEVYFEDNLNNTFTLLNTGNHTFTADSNFSGIGRFFLRFDAPTLNTNENNLNSILIYTTANPKKIMVKGNLLDTTKAMLYDMQGREILSQLLDMDKGLQTIDVTNLSSGVYVVKLQSKNYMMSKKVIIK